MQTLTLTATHILPPDHPMGDFTLNGLLVETNVGSGQSMFLGGGFRDRILFDQHRPAQLIAQNIRSSAAFREAIVTQSPVRGDDRGHII